MTTPVPLFRSREQEGAAGVRGVEGGDGPEEDPVLLRLRGAAARDHQDPGQGPRAI